MKTLPCCLPITAVLFASASLLIAQTHRNSGAVWYVAQGSPEETAEAETATANGEEFQEVEIGEEDEEPAEEEAASFVMPENQGVQDPAQIFGAEEGAAFTEEDTISVDFPNEDVKTIIRNVAVLYDLNVVIPDQLIGTSSIKLRNVTWRQVFEVVLEPLGYTYVEDGNIIKIISEAERQQEPPINRVFFINYAVAGRLQSSLQPLLSEVGRIQVDARTNGLIVTERPSKMTAIEALIEKLDRPNPQVMIESKFLEIAETSNRDLGFDWSDSVTVTADSIGRTYGAAEGVTATETVIAGVSGGVTETFTSSTNRADTAVFSASQLQATLNAVQQNSNVRLVSNPTLVTMDGEQATIAVGDEFPLVTEFTFNDATGTFEPNVEYEQLGVTLTVTPQVNASGFIRLTVSPTLKNVGAQAPVAGVGGSTLPIIQNRSVVTSVVIRNGYTLALGGLIREESSDTDTKTPILGDIPLLGELFSNESKDTFRSNLVIFITAKTLNPDGSSYRDILDPRQLLELDISEADVPGYDIPEQQREDIFTIQDERADVENAAREERIRELLNKPEPAPEPNMLMENALDDSEEVLESGTSADSGDSITSTYTFPPREARPYPAQQPAPAPAPQPNTSTAPSSQFTFPPRGTSGN